MRRSVLLGLAAASAAVAVVVPALSTAANASTTTSTTTSTSTSTSAAQHTDPSDYDSHWGTYWSNNHLAKANGFIDVSYDDDESNTVHINGRLWDLDHRTYQQGGKCAYIKFRVQSWDDGEDDWSSSVKSYKYCGAGGYKSINFWRYDVAQVQAKVCQIGLYSNFPTKCGSWHDLYNAYDDSYGYDS